MVLRGERISNDPDLLDYLRELYSVNYMEHGKPDEPHGFSGILTVRKGDGSAGRGTKKKRMPPCNEVDKVF